MEAIRAGRCFMSESPSGPQLLFDREGGAIRVRVAGARGDTLVLVGPNGAVQAKALASDDETVTLPVVALLSAMPEATASYVRAQVQDTTGVIRALSNPLWLDD